MANTINPERYAGKQLPEFYVGRIRALSKGKQVIMDLALFDHTQVIAKANLFNPGVARFPLPTSYTPELSITPSIQPQTTAVPVSEAATATTAESSAPTSVEQQADLSVEQALAKAYAVHDGRNN